MLRRLNRRIALTGAIVPQKGFIASDTGFNLGMSMAALEADFNQRLLVIMNGSIFDAETVQKDTTTSTFTNANGRDLLPYDNFSLIPAGGSMDFVPDGLDGMVPAEESAIPDFLRENVRTNHRFTSTTPFIVDSRAIQQTDLDTLTDVVRAGTEEHSLIITGIYKIREVQAHLRKRLEASGSGRRIMLTGSRLPLTVGDQTDAPFQLGYALGKMGYTEPGVNIALNGRIMTDQANIIEEVYTAREIERLKTMGVISSN